MTVGHSDYGVTQTQVNEPQSSDTLELSAREGIYIPYARSGNVIFNLNPVLFAASSRMIGSSGWWWIPSSKIAFFGYTHSIKYVVASGVSLQAGAQFSVPPTSSQQFGLMTYLGYYAYNAILTFNCILHISGVRHQAELFFNTNTGVLSYYGADGNSHTILTQSLSSFSQWPIIVKFTFNLATGKYGKLWWNSSTALDLSSYSYYQASEPQADAFIIQIFMNNQEAVANYFYLQDAIVTINEVI